MTLGDAIHAGTEEAVSSWFIILDGRGWVMERRRCPRRRHRYRMLRRDWCRAGQAGRGGETG